MLPEVIWVGANARVLCELPERFLVRDFTLFCSLSITDTGGSTEIELPFF